MEKLTFTDSIQLRIRQRKKMTREAEHNVYSENESCSYANLESTEQFRDECYEHQRMLSFNFTKIYEIKGAEI